MINVRKIQYKSGSREELLPGFNPKFPYIASMSELNKFPGKQAPWHWHKEVELFYVERGAIVYHTPSGELTIREGSCGFVNSNILHMTSSLHEIPETALLLHIFDPVLISGQPGSLIDEKYVAPLVSRSGVELISISPETEAGKSLIGLIRNSFLLNQNDPAYEIHLRFTLSEIWYTLLSDINHFQLIRAGHVRSNEKIKLMIAFINEHYSEKIVIRDIAAAAFISERECFRVFKDCLHTTPVEYLKNYRLQNACRLLLRSRESITEISQLCGLGSSSYFGKTFREQFGCTPAQYRRHLAEF